MLFIYIFFTYRIKDKHKCENTLSPRSKCTSYLYMENNNNNNNNAERWGTRGNVLAFWTMSAPSQMAPTIWVWRTKTCSPYLSPDGYILAQTVQFLPPNPWQSEKHPEHVIKLKWGKWTFSVLQKIALHSRTDKNTITTTSMTKVYVEIMFSILAACNAVAHFSPIKYCF